MVGQPRSNALCPAKSTHQSINLDSLDGLQFRCVGHIRDSAIISSSENAVAVLAARV